MRALLLPIGAVLLGAALLRCQGFTETTADAGASVSPDAPAVSPDAPAVSPVDGAPSDASGLADSAAFATLSGVRPLDRGRNASASASSTFAAIGGGAAGGAALPRGAEGSGVGAFEGFGVG